MKKPFLLMIVLGFIILTLSACTQDKKITYFNEDGTSKTVSTKDLVADKVEVFVFHSTQRCISCITIGKFAGETVNEYFQPELRDGKIEFKEINIDLPENKELARKFQASGSSLFINAIYDDTDHIKEDTKVWRLVNSEDQFKTYLKGVINNNFGK
ncbi:hypothetical protein AUJ26_00830 [Candidatus Falkowbacteria bacterium CG1_02_37_21]|nr:MAG: hypothetical protein AUJ26_00830 [Candidatus Falkowbacteria bacterium CG1_02_37_21]